MVRKLIIAALMSISLKMAVCQPGGGKAIKIANVERDAVYTQDSVYVVSDVHFRKKSTDRWLLGNHYRREWSIPVKVPNILLDTFQGGAYVIKESGGKQTKTLRLQLDRDSRKQYQLRSVEKYVEKALPAEFEGTLATRLVKDQISSAHPFAAIVVTPLAAAADILHTNPRMVFVPSSPRLKKFDSLYGNRLYLLEERPHGNWEEASFFGHASNIINTEKLRIQLQESASTIVDQRAFLRARLLDLLIGDWDRHEDQWAWANVKQNDTIVYQPIPKDRDQAFANLDGVLPWFGRRKWAFRRGQHFTSEIKDIKGLTWSARNLDRLLLNSLDWKDWRKEIDFLKRRWTKEIIEDAVRRLPQELYSISGSSIAQKLITRQNDLENIAFRFYTVLAVDVEWTGTDQDDIFTIKNINDSTFAVNQSVRKGTNTFFIRQRIFNTAETKVITLYGLKGNDAFLYEQEKAIHVRFRFVGGEGENSYVAPESAGHSLVTVYDQAISSNITVKPFRLKKRYDSLTHDYHYNHHPYSILRPFFQPAYNPDDGILIGAGISYQRSHWGHFPFSQHHVVQASYAFRTKAYHFTYEGIFKKVLGRWDVYVNGQLHQPGYGQNFYGLGNETKLSTKNREYNRVRIDQIQVRTGLQRIANTIHTIRLLGEFLSVHVQENDKRFVSKSNPQLDSTDFVKTAWVGGTLAYELNTRNDLIFPTRGLRWRNELSYLGADKGARNIVRPASSLSAYLSLGSVVLAARVGGATLWGEPHFFQYNQLSSLENLRGYRRSRFSGKSLLFTNSELRVPLTYVKGLFVNGQMGTLIFCDNGRVWIPDEKSHQWHWGYGAGFWLIPFNRIAVVAQMGVSGEDKVFTLKTGFLF